MRKELTLEETIQALNLAMPAQTGETPVPKNKPAYADVYYTDANDERQSLDTYLPKLSDGLVLVIVYIYCGVRTSVLKVYLPNVGLFQRVAGMSVKQRSIETLRQMPLPATKSLAIQPYFSEVAAAARHPTASPALPTILNGTA